MPSTEKSDTITLRFTEEELRYIRMYLMTYIPEVGYDKTLDESIMEALDDAIETMEEDRASRS